MTERISFGRSVAAMAVFALLATMLPHVPVAQAATTGLTVDSTSLTTPVGVQVNFVMSTETDDNTTTPGTVVAVSDSGAGGSFYDGTTGGNCNQDTPDSDEEFGINRNQAICYSNDVAGVYSISTVLLNASSTPIAIGPTISVTVEEEVVDPGNGNGNGGQSDGDGTEQNPYTNPQGNIDICHATGADTYVSNSPNLSSIINGTGHAGNGAVHDDDIIPAFWHQVDANDPAEFYPGRNFDAAGEAVLANDCVVPADDTGTTTDDGTGTTTDDGTGTTTDDGTGTTTDDGTGTTTDDGTGTTTDDGTGTTTDDGTGTTTDDGSGSNDNDTADKCEFEGHKYDQNGTPLEGWDISLIKVITYEGQTYVYTIDTDVTDVDGFYCLRWSDVWTPAYNAADFPNGYEFEYRVTETKQTDWEFVTAEHGPDVANLAVTTLDLLTFTETQVQHMVGEANGFVLADAEYHLDFYNRHTGSTTDNGGGDDGDDFAPLTLTSVCRVTDGGMTFNVTNDNAFAITAAYEVLGTTDTATVTAAAMGVTSFTTATATAAGTTTLSYDYASSSYSTSTVAVDTACDPTNVSNPGGGSGSSGGGGGNPASGGGSSSGTRTDRNGGEPTVAGISDSPAPLVLGEQVDAVPLGGANTGAGGAATTAPSAAAFLTLLGLAAVLRMRITNA